MSHPSGLPKELAIEPVNTECIIVAGSDPYHYVADVNTCNQMTSDEEKAFVERLVLAWNCHTKLLDALHVALGKILNECCGADMKPEGHTAYVVDSIKAAIAEAEGGE